MKYKGFIISELESCWGDQQYFGYMDNKQITEGFDTIEEVQDEIDLQY